MIVTHGDMVIKNVREDHMKHDNKRIQTLITAFEEAGYPVTDVIRLEEDTRTEPSILDFDLRLKEGDELNITIDNDDDAMWHDFSHSTPIGNIGTGVGVLHRIVREAIRSVSMSAKT